MKIQGMKTFFRSLGKRHVQHNVAYFYFYNFFSGLIFSLPIWVLFYRRVVDFPQLAFLNAFQSIITTVLEIPTGALADLIGRRKTVLMGLIVSAISFVGVGLSNSFVELFLCQIGIGVSAALISGADSAILYDTLKETGKEDDYGNVSLQLGFLFRTGLIIGSFSGGFLYSVWISLPYLVRAFCLLIAAIAVWFTVEPTIDSEKFSWANYVKQTKQGLKEISKSHYMRKLVFYYVFVSGITWACLHYFAQPFALDFGYSEQQMSLVFGSVYFAVTVILYILTSIPNLLTRERVYLGFPLLMALSFLPAYFVPKFFAPLIILGVQLAGSGRYSILDKYTNKEFDPKNRATANSTINMLVEIFMIAAVLIGGQIQDLYNTRIIYTGLGFVTLLFVMPFAIQLIKEHRSYQKARLAAAQVPAAQ